jgi:probable HAF family extracellular repeat protein
MSQFDFANVWSPQGQIMTRDMIAMGQGNTVPAHINAAAKVASLSHSFRICQEAADIARKAASHLERKGRKQGINGSGQIVGYYLDGNGDKHGFLDSSGTYTTLDYPSARQTFAQSINGAGQIVGSSANDGHAFLYSGGTYTPLDSALNGGTPFSINDSGQIVGTYSTFENGGFKTHGFLYSNGTFITLDYPGATNGTFAYGINNQGQIVGYYSDFDDIHGGGGIHGFLYSGGTYTTLDDPLAATVTTSGTEAFGINDAGQIVGTYQDSNHHYHGFLLTIAPNPPPPVGTTADMILRGSNNSPPWRASTKFTTSGITRFWQLTRWAKSELIGASSRSAAFSAAIRPTCCCAAPAPAASKSTTSATTTLAMPLSSAASA